MESAIDMVGSFLFSQSCQLILVFSVALILTFCLRNKSAHLRYLLWLLVIGKCLTPSMFSVPVALLPESANAGTFRTLDQVVPVSSEVERSELDSMRFARQHEHLENGSILPNSNEPGKQTVHSPVSGGDPTLTPRLGSQAKQISFQAWLVLGWGVVATVFLTVLLVKMFETQRRLRHSRWLADEKTRDTVSRLAAKLSLREPPAVYLANSSKQPFVWGWLRGDIYLPSQFASTGDDDARNAILTHELAHVARWDAAINLVQMTVQAVFFFHPLVWWANKMIRQERENCCDELVLADPHTTPRGYCEAIVDMLDPNRHPTHSTPILAITGSTKNLEARINTMLSPNRTFSRGPSRIVLATLFLASLMVLPTALVITNRTAAANTNEQDQKKEKQDTATNQDVWQPGQEMEFRVINAITKEPMEGVSLELQNAGKGIDFSDVKVQTTDAEGKSIIKLPDLPPSAVRVYPSKPGFVPLRVYWADTPFPVMPKTVTIPMQPGKPIGGKIVDEEGNPISGVEISVHYWGEGKGTNPHIRANVCADNFKTKGLATSDEQGKWEIVEMPEYVKADDLRIYLNHPNFVSDHLQPGYISKPVCETPALKDLFAASAVMQLKKGAVVRGRVFGESGSPLANAEIYLNKNSGFRDESPAAISKSKGEFQISGLPTIEPNRFPGPQGRDLISLTVVAKGFAPELVQVRDVAEPIRVNLSPGLTVEGRVVDKNGEPLAKAGIYAEQWRGGFRNIKLEAKTDADGKFRIDDAPADEVKYQISKRGYMYAENWILKPDHDNDAIVLGDLLRVSGSVVDAETGKPINRFSVFDGIDYENGWAPDWRGRMGKTERNGSYRLEFRQTGAQRRIRIEAEGYMPVESDIIRGDDPTNRNITFDVRLKKTDPIQGSVIGLDGIPLTGAKVYLATSHFRINNRQDSVYDRGSRQTVTDTNGRFEFQPEVEPFCLVVVHEQGVGMIIEKDLEDSTQIKLEPWNKENQRVQIVRRPTKDEGVQFPPRTK